MTKRPGFDQHAHCLHVTTIITGTIAEIFCQGDGDVPHKLHPIIFSPARRAHAHNMRSVGDPNSGDPTVKFAGIRSTVYLKVRSSSFSDFSSPATSFSRPIFASKFPYRAAAQSGGPLRRASLITAPLCGRFRRLVVRPLYPPFPEFGEGNDISRSVGLSAGKLGLCTRPKGLAWLRPFTQHHRSSTTI